MKVIETALPGVLIIEPKVFGDHRGFFLETFQVDRYREIGIELPFEQELNPYVHKSVTMRYFFTRKVVLVKYSYAFVVMPGGAFALPSFTLFDNPFHL